MTKIDATIAAELDAHEVLKAGALASMSTAAAAPQNTPSADARVRCRE
jgi:hypothetical protein